MAEYIKREDALQHKRKMRCADFHGSFWDFIVLCEDIKRIPAADVVEVRHGNWRWVGYGNDQICTLCQGYHNAKSKYCPNCGAKMDGKGEQSLLFSDMEEIIDAAD